MRKKGHFSRKLGAKGCGICATNLAEMAVKIATELRLETLFVIQTWGGEVLQICRYIVCVSICHCWITDAFTIVLVVFLIYLNINSLSICLTENLMTKKKLSRFVPVR